MNSYQKHLKGQRLSMPVNWFNTFWVSFFDVFYYPILLPENKDKIRLLDEIFAALTWAILSFLWNTERIPSVSGSASS